MICQVLKPAVAATVGSMPVSAPILAQILSPAPKRAHVEITQEPTLEMGVDDLAIIRWTTGNPGGDDQHFGIARYGTDPRELSGIAKSPIRLNRGDPETIFRVRVEGLKPSVRLRAVRRAGSLVLDTRIPSQGSNPAVPAIIVGSTLFKASTNLFSNPPSITCSNLPSAG